MVRASAKKTAMACLVAAFAIQTTLVYTDERQDPLSDAALRGRSLWHETACQVCHQVYGQGGFLGPDLTNAASRVEGSRLQSLLTVGSGQMPAFHFSSEQIADLTAYLEALDRPDLGRGQLRLGSAPEGSGPWGVFGGVVKDALSTAPPEAMAGYAAFEARPCTSCHFPLSDSPVGAPDLSTVTGRLSSEELGRVLTVGRPELGMPPPIPAFEAAEREAVIEFLSWLGESREDLETGLARASSGAGPIEWGRMPWWEFR
jgi:nitric oxide reductase subunit C